MLLSCRGDKEQDIIPNVIVDIQINLSNLEFQPLQNEGGHVTIDGGVRGIILYRAANNYRAFERNCPTAPSEDCETVAVDGSNLFIQCPCCSSQFDFEGNLTSGPSPFPLKQYSTSVNNNFLSITN